MRTLIVGLLATVAVPLHAANIWFDPPDPTTNTHVIAHLRTFGCPVSSASVQVNGNIVSITLNGSPVCGAPPPLEGYRLTVDLGTLPAGVYDVVAGPQNLLVAIAEGTLVVREANPGVIVRPNVSPTSGGTKVLIKAVPDDVCNISPCPPLSVLFGGVPATDITVTNGDIVATAPPHAAGIVDVTWSFMSTRVARNACEYFDLASTTFDPAFFEPILFPTMVTGPGAFGAQWSTDVTLRNENDFALPVVSIFDTPCTPVCNTRPPAHATRRSPSVNLPNGYVMNVPRDAEPNLFFNILVRDLSRQAAALGAQVPVVRERDLFDRQFSLLDVPGDARYRVALRIYRIDGGTGVHMRVLTLTDEMLVDDFFILSPVTPQLNAAMIGDLLTKYPILTGKGPLRVEITGSTDIRATYAFVSVTNNETQNVTIIAPE